MESKIKIKLGPIEVEYEGSEAFLKKELPGLIRTVAELYKMADLQTENESDTTNKEMDSGGKTIELSTNSIATKLSVKTGRDLAIAAAAHLTFVKGKKLFSRIELLDEMKSANSFYKASNSRHLTEILGRLIKTKFNEPSSGNYTLTPGAENDLRAKLV